MTALDMWRSWLLVVGMVCFMTGAQIFFKLAGLHSVHQTALINAWIYNPWLWLAIVALAISLVLWLFALRRLSLSTAYPWTALVYVLTPLGSAIIFQDLLTLRYLLGMTCIVVGVIRTTSASSEFG